MPIGKGTLPGGYPVLNSTTTLEELLEAVSQMPEPRPLQISASVPLPTDAPAFNPVPNPAVIRCCQSYTQAFNAALKAGERNYQAEIDGNRAYREALPPLSGTKNIRNFIACIARAMVLRIIDNQDGSRLLYAAKVALSAHSRRPKTRRIPNQSNDIQQDSLAKT